MEPPPKPDPSDCCNSGCTPCIYDVYEQQLRAFRSRKPPAISPRQNAISLLAYTNFALASIEPHTPDTYIYTFTCIAPPKDSELYYNPGQHFLLKANGFTRAYTPIPPQPHRHGFRILVRLHDLGRMSNYLKTLKIGTPTVWRGPYGTFKRNFVCKNILFVAQGTGIAPIYALLNEILEDEECESILKLFYCCRGVEEVALRDDLYSWLRYWNFTYELFLGGGGEGKYNEVVRFERLGKGRIEEYFEGRKDVRVVVCGSEAFCGDVVRFCEDCGADKSDIFVF